MKIDGVATSCTFLFFNVYENDILAFVRLEKKTFRHDFISSSTYSFITKYSKKPIIDGVSENHQMCYNLFFLIQWSIYINIPTATVRDTVETTFCDLNQFFKDLIFFHYNAIHLGENCEIVPLRLFLKHLNIIFLYFLLPTS